MLIEGKSLTHWIDNFFGYEESGGDVPKEVVERINYFYKERQPATSPINARSTPILSLANPTGLHPFRNWILV